jgi:CxxC motif-containing protein
MSDIAKFVCIGCPIGCPLQLTHEGLEILEVEGNQCNRGAKYARQEFTDPRRSMSTTVAIDGARHGRLPVKVSKQVPKDRVREAAALIHRIRVRAPVRRGDVLIHDLLGEPGVDVVATRSMDAL